MASRIKPVDNTTDVHKIKSINAPAVNAIIANHGIIVTKASRNSVTCNMSRVDRKMTALSGINMPSCDHHFIESLAITADAVPNSLNQPYTPSSQST